jgi:hypothetical protein
LAQSANRFGIPGTQQQSFDLKFSPTNPNFMAVQGSRDLQIFEQRKESQTLDRRQDQGFGLKFKLKVIADVNLNCVYLSS